MMVYWILTFQRGQPAPDAIFEDGLPMLNIQTYVRAKSLEEAYTLNQKRNARVLGGMLWLKMASNTVGTAIDLCELGLDTIEEDETGFTLGAMATLRMLEQHPGLAAYTQNAAAKAVQDIVGVQFRNMAAVGGSVWGRFGFSDVLTLLLAADARVNLYKAGTLPIETFAVMPYDRDLLISVTVPKYRDAAFAYKAMRIQRTDLPVLNCAPARLAAESRLAVGARPGKAVLLRDENGLLADGITPESAAAFAAYAAKNVPTGANARGSAEYRTHLVEVLTRRCALELEGDPLCR